MKTNLFLVSLFIALSAGVYAQKKIKPEPIHEINIYKWAKDKDSVSYDTIVIIDSEGKVNVVERTEGDENTFEATDKFKMKNIEKAFFGLINEKKIVWKAAYNDEDMGMAVEPEPGKQVLHITIVTQKDFAEQGEKDYPAEYFTIIEADYSDHKPQELFKHLKKNEAELLKKFLYQEK